MEDSRRALAKAHELFEALGTEWSLEECEALALEILTKARKICHQDIAITKANLLAALILAIDEDLRVEEKTVLARIRQQAPRGTA